MPFYQITRSGPGPQTWGPGHPAAFKMVTCLVQVQSESSSIKPKPGPAHLMLYRSGPSLWLPQVQPIQWSSRHVRILVHTATRDAELLTSFDQGGHCWCTVVDSFDYVLIPLTSPAVCLPYLPGTGGLKVSVYVTRWRVSQYSWSRFWVSIAFELVHKKDTIQTQLALSSQCARVCRCMPTHSCVCACLHVKNDVICSHAVLAEKRLPKWCYKKSE